MEQYQEGVWHKDSLLLFTVKQDGWRKGQPAMINHLTVRVEAANQTPQAEADALATELHQYLQHRAAAHATGEAGEGLTNRLADLLVDYYSNEYEYCTDDEAKVRAFPVAEAILAALTPAPAQTPQPAAPRCGGGGVDAEAVMKFLKDTERWEANVLMEDAAWYTPASHPWLTDELYDEWMELQSARNELIEAMTPTCPNDCRTCPAGDAGAAAGAKEGGSHE